MERKVGNIFAITDEIQIIPPEQDTHVRYLKMRRKKELQLILLNVIDILFSFPCFMLHIYCSLLNVPRLMSRFKINYFYTYRDSRTWIAPMSIRPSTSTQEETAEQRTVQRFFIVRLQQIKWRVWNEIKFEYLSRWHLLVWNWNLPTLSHTDDNGMDGNFSFCAVKR